MSEKKPTYLEEQLEAVMTRHNNEYTFVFQKEKIRLDRSVEIEMLKDVNTAFQKEIMMSDDELKITIKPTSEFQPFTALRGKEEQQKWLFADQLIKKIKQHSFSRLHLLICPENIIFDKSLSPAFLHYGVKESLPPYEPNEEQSFQELKATIAAAVDSSHTFEQYFKLYETLQLKEDAKKIMHISNEEELSQFVQHELTQIEKHQKTLVQLPQKRWTIFKFSSVGILVLLIPALIYTFYSYFFAQPKQEAFVESNEYFLEKNYSKVVDTLEDYDIESMPKIVQYEIATSYLVNEKLGEEQKANALKTITLQSDPQYFAYWFYIGRGDNKKALEVSRLLEERSLIIYALMKYEGQLKTDNDLAADKKQEELDKVANELEEFKKENDQQEAEAAKQQEEKQAEEAQAAKQQEEEQKAAEAEKKKQEEQKKQQEDQSK
ncbi:type VII secretion protein EssB [Priestia megaterium]|uniref:type VII secretion protein EssB n=1 Tax=Priestia megaterium TaxID=1404 RepID=UPI00300162A4